MHILEEKRKALKEEIKEAIKNQDAERLRQAIGRLEAVGGADQTELDKAKAALNYLVIARGK